MSTWRCLLLSALALVGLSSVSLEYLQAPPSSETAPPAPVPLTPDPVANNLLDGAVGALSPPRLIWASAEMWQQANAGEMVFAATGVYRIGPQEQRDLGLRIVAGNHRGEKVFASDGVAHVEANCADGGPWTMQSPDACPVRSPAALLDELREKVVFFRHESARWQGRSVWVLTGAVDSPPSDVPPVMQPHQCRLVLDAETGWPHRLEWWGAELAGGPDHLLLQVEYRNPVLNRPLEARLFTFRPEVGVDNRSR